MASNYLSILFEKGGLSFLVTKDDKIIESNSILYEPAISLEKNLAKILSENLYLKQDYQKVSLSFLGGKFIIVPNEYYDNDNEKWLGFNTEIEDIDIIQKELLTSLDAVLIYSIPQEIIEFTETNFNTKNVIHSGRIFLNHLEINDDKAQVFLLKHQQQFEIMVVKNQKLNLYNIFDYKTKEDITYHLLNILKQLNIDTNIVELYYYGEYDDIMLKMIMNFIRHVIPATSDLNRMKHFTLIENLQLNL